MKLLVTDTISGQIDLIHNVDACCSTTELLIELGYDINGVEILWLSDDFTFEDIHQYNLKHTKELCFG